MKKLVFLAALCVAFFAVFTASAQNVVTNISTSDFSTCKKYLDVHPTDTIKSAQSADITAELAEKAKKAGLDTSEGLFCVVSVFKLSDGKIARHIAYTSTSPVEPLPIVLAPTPRQEVNVVKVVKTESRVGAVTSKKDTLWYDRTSAANVSFNDKVAVNRGEKVAVDPHHKDLEGKFRHRVYMSALGGAILTNKGDFHPVFGGRLGYETCHFLFELEGVYSQQNYTDVAEVTGRYNTFAAYLTAGWKFWQSPLYRSYLAVGASGGFAYQKTDMEDAEFYSSNYGAAGKVFLRGLWGLNRNFGLVFEGGYNLLPWVEHYGGEQEWNHGGAYLQAGINYKF
ncbi:MAG: hypothetical protein J6J35_03345 [Alphaproteobacteria bacterium]|nr:hypothetical protein [Alphaproteobacteria bacterium]